MKTLNIKSTDYHPKVEYNKEAKQLMLQGKSLAENPQSWYQALIEEISPMLNRNEINILILHFEYFNTASAKQIYQLIKHCKTMQQALTVEWHYNKNDDDMLETGEDYEEMCGFKFKFIERGVGY